MQGCGRPAAAASSSLAGRLRLAFERQLKAIRSDIAKGSHPRGPFAKDTRREPRDLPYHFVGGLNLRIESLMHPTCTPSCAIWFPNAKALQNQRPNQPGLFLQMMELGCSPH